MGYGTIPAMPCDAVYVRGCAQCKARRKGHACVPFGNLDAARDQRLENWNERRAFALPYFLRSTTRLSRVRKPPRLSAPRRSGSK